MAYGPMVAMNLWSMEAGVALSLGQRWFALRPVVGSGLVVLALGSTQARTACSDGATGAYSWHCWCVGGGLCGSFVSVSCQLCRPQQHGGGQRHHPPRNRLSMDYEPARTCCAQYPGADIFERLKSKVVVDALGSA